jgi:zinc/manganese transport system substrate-binding protein/manganese/iron transport system substrate-binding protein
VFRPAAVAAAALLAALALAACGGGQDSAPSPAASPQRTVHVSRATLPIRVGATLPLFADFARELGKENVEVFSILPPGADPHTYEPTPSDIRRIAEADIIFVNDREPGVEGAVLDLIQDNKREDTKFIAFMPNIRSPSGERADDPYFTAAKAGDNPHLWLDPFLARSYVDLIADTFIIEDGINADFYNDNRKAYRQRLTQLDNDIAALVDQIPTENRTLVTSHDAFVHFAERFGLELVGFVVPGPGQDPSPSDIADLSQAIRDQGVPAVFVEPQVGTESRLLRQIAADVSVEVCTLYSDSLDDDVPTYIDLMRFNADEHARCLGV